MQTIQLKKFGNVLVSRPLGQEAFNAIRPQLSSEVPIQIDFDEVLTITPSWLDEFLSQLTNFNQGKVELLPTTNPSVLAALPVLATARKDFVADVASRALKKIQG